MKRFYSTIVILFQVTYAFTQSLPNVSVGIYSKCDTCFVLTANADTLHPAPYTYQWNFSGGTPLIASGQTITFCSKFPLSSDTLLLVVTGSDAVQQNYFCTLNNLLPGIGVNNTMQPVCIVSVDTSINKNRIVWEQTTDSTITSYNLYKETTFTGVYSLLANIARSVFSTYTDTSSAPNVKSARYRMTTVDTCGSESPVSASHKTMHLTVSSGIPPAWNLIWENYEGLSFLKYRIWRKSISNGWQLIDSVSSSSTTYTDLTPPAGLLYYELEILSPTACNPSLKTQNILTNYSSSLSNLDDNGLAGINENNFSFAVSVSPNPFSHSTTLKSDKFLTHASIVIYNTLGEQVKQLTNISGQTIIFQRDNLPAGLYFFRLSQNDMTFTAEKIIIADN